MKKLFTTFLLLTVSVFPLLAQSNLVWEKNLVKAADTAQSAITSLTLDRHSNLIATGNFTGTVDFNPGQGVFNLQSDSKKGYTMDLYADFVQKYDKDGNFLWTKMIENNTVSYTEAVVDKHGNIYISGAFTDTVDFNPGSGVYQLATSYQTNYWDDELYLLKLDPQGNFIWARSYGPSSSNTQHLLKMDKQGNIYVMGSFEGTIDLDPGTGVYNLEGTGDFLQKLNPEGNFAWATKIEADIRDLAFDTTGNLYLALETNVSASFETSDMAIQKLDPEAKVLWTKTFNTTTHETPYEIDVDSKGSVYVTGTSFGELDLDPNNGAFYLQDYNNFLLKLNAKGEFVWAKSTIGAAGNLKIDKKDNVMLTGSFIGTADFDPSESTYNLTATPYTPNPFHVYSDIFLQKLDSTGSFLWAYKRGQWSQDFHYAITVDSAGNTYTGGAIKDVTNITTDENIIYSDASIIKWGPSAPIITSLAAANSTMIQQAFPNPTNGFTTISLSEHTVEAKVEVVDVYGKIIQSERVQNTSQIHLNVTAPKGIYTIAVSTEKGKSAFKLLKD